MTEAPHRLVRCLIVGEFPAPDLELIRRELPAGRVELVLAGAGEDLSRLGQFQVIWRLFPATIDGEGLDLFPAALHAHPEVQWVHTASAGIDHLAQQFADRSGTILTHSAGVAAIPIAEFVVGCLLQHCKRSKELAQLQLERRFVQLPLREVADLRVVLFGLGEIATEVARRLAAFGCRVDGVRRDPTRPGPPGVSQVFGFPKLAQACRGADALVLAAPLTRVTERAVNAEVLAELSPQSVLVNVARGGLVDEESLLLAVAGGRPAAAYLDAFVQEPLPVNSPLWAAAGIHVSPHLSWSSPHLARRTTQLFIDQLRRWLEQEPLRNLADPQLGY